MGFFAVVVFLKGGKCQKYIRSN